MNNLELVPRVMLRIGDVFIQHHWPEPFYAENSLVITVNAVTNGFQAALLARFYMVVACIFPGAQFTILLIHFFDFTGTNAAILVIGPVSFQSFFDTV